MSDVDPSGTAAAGRGWLTAELASGADADLPCEVRGLNSIVVARGLVGRAIVVPAGRYLVTARDADGTEFAVDEPVDVPPGSHTIARLGVSASAPRHGASGAIPRMQTPAAAVPQGDQPAMPAAEPLRVRFQLAEDPLLALLSTEHMAAPAASAAETGTWGAEGPEPVRTPFQSPSVVDVEVAPVAEGSEPMRYRLIIPVDQKGSAANGFTTLSVARTPDRALGTEVELATPANSQRFLYDFDLEFEDGWLQRFWSFITKASFREAWASSEALAADVEENGEGWVRDKLRSPVAGILGGYVLLRANRLDRLSVWSENLARWFPESADAQAIRAEVLSREGRHAEAAQHLMSLDRIGCPCIRSGIQYAWQMAGTYSEARGQDELQTLDDAAFARLEALRRALGRLSGNVDPRRLNTVIYWRFPERRSAP